jgi:hypothetical protein
VEYPVVHFGNISWSVMRILAVVPNLYDTSPGQRFRIEWDPLLRERGVEISYAPFECEELRSHLYNSGNLRRKVAQKAEILTRGASADPREKVVGLR